MVVGSEVGLLSVVVVDLVWSKRGGFCKGGVFQKAFLEPGQRVFFAKGGFSKGLFRARPEGGFSKGGFFNRVIFLANFPRA